MGASAKGLTSGMGLIPVGGAARTIVAVIKPGSSTSKQTVCSYGTANTRQGQYLTLNASAAGQAEYAGYADDADISNSGCNSQRWALMVAVYDGSTCTTLFYDGQILTHTLGAALNTVDAGNHFSIAQDLSNAAQGSMYLDDLAVFNRALAGWEVNELWDSLGR
jgi:hypothetical protein